MTVTLIDSDENEIAVVSVEYLPDVIVFKGDAYYQFKYGVYQSKGSVIVVSDSDVVWRV